MNSSAPVDNANQSSQSIQSAQQSNPTDNKASEQRTKNNNLKSNFVCPLSQFIFLKPALLNCGEAHFVEEQMGQKLLRGTEPCCPYPTCEKPVTNLMPSDFMRVTVDDFLLAHPEFKDERYVLEPETKEAKVETVAPVSSSSPDPFVPTLSPEEMAQQHLVLQQAAAERQQRNNPTPIPSVVPVHNVEANANNRAPIRRIAPRHNRGNVQPQQSVSVDPIHVSAPINRSALIDAKAVSSQSMFANNNNQQAQAAKPKIIKVVVVGYEDTGKSQFVSQFVQDDSLSLRTIGIDFKIKNMNVNGANCKLQIFPLIQDRFSTIPDVYYKSADAIIIMYNAGSAESFDMINSWKSECDSHAKPNAAFLLVSNDTGAVVESKNVISSDQGQALANQLGMKFFACSTRNNVNIDSAFTALCQDVLAKQAAANANNNPPAPDSKKDGGKCTIM